MIKEKSWIIYCWYDNDGVPYFLSKCRSSSKAPYKKRPESRIQAPENRSQIRILFASTNEDEVIQKYDELQYTIGLVDAGSGGTLRNSIKHNPKALRETRNGRAIPIDVYDLKGKMVGKFASVGDAIECLDLNAGNAFSALYGDLWSHCGYVITYRGEGFRSKPYKREMWNTKKLWAYSPEGVPYKFHNMSEAAETIYGDKKQRASLYSSIRSPETNKRRAKGWMVFDYEDLPQFSDIMIARNGRAKPIAAELLNK